MLDGRICAERQLQGETVREPPALKPSVSSMWLGSGVNMMASERRAGFVLMNMLSTSSQNVLTALALALHTRIPVPGPHRPADPRQTQRVLSPFLESECYFCVVLHVVFRFYLQISIQIIGFLLSDSPPPSL